MALDSILNLAKRSESLKRIKDKIKSGEKEIFLSGLSGSSKGFFLSYLFEIFGLPTLVITSNPEEAQNIADDLISFLGEEKVFYFPSWEILPYEFSFPSSEVIGKRLLALFNLILKKNVIVVASVRSAFEKTLTPSQFRNSCLNLKKGENKNLSFLVEKLLNLGFVRYPQVEEVGSFSLRGGILDIFPYSSEDPVRIEFFGDVIESIREFSILTQRTIKKIKDAVILPKREVLISDEKIEEYLSKIEPEKADKLRQKINLFQEIPGLEWMGSLFDIPQSTLFDYFGEKSLLFLDEPQSIQDQLEYIFEETESLYNQTIKKGELVPNPEKLWESPKKFEEKIKKFQNIKNLSFIDTRKEVIDLKIKEHQRIDSDLFFLKKRIEEQKDRGYSTYILCENEGQKQRLSELLENQIDKVEIQIGYLSSGFTFPEIGLELFTEHQIFSRHFRKRRKKRFKEGLALSSYNALSQGDFVVHIDFGIGRYDGLKEILVDGRKRDCLSLLYEGEDKLYVPIEEFNRVHKFVGKEGEPKLSRLGGASWENLKRRTKKAIKDMAKELIKVHAERKTKAKHPISPDALWQKELESSFIYEETPDQVEAIDAIKKDMEKPIPMDRLVCGDVGYGKTEVAIRASFKCVMDGKQVAVLAPTTILTQQHLTTFSDRLKEFPLRIEMLSRFKKRAEQKKIIEELKQGKIDVIIGTHRLLQNDVKFKELGLLIIDEEQRFGVAHKEKIKKLKTLVDVLTLTATPIPRTMQLSLYGIKDMSVINTPPKERLPIHTEVLQFDPEVIFEAILREIDRGGQVYFVHNRVHSIESIYRFLQLLLPHLRIGIAHGQMEEKTLERVMLDFLEKKYDCLLATSIIESGLDIPNVNTMIINRADRFGLAQLYQLRGRVGRSNQKAYAYLLIPPLKVLNETAKKRLKAILQYTELGSGFYLSLRDLEIRGAGNILGLQQHGFIEEIGYDLYCKLLDEAIRELKGEKVTKKPETKIRVDLDLYIPPTYIPDDKQRVEIYQKIADSKTLESLEELRSEIVDRFGRPPQQILDLLTLAQSKLIAQKNLISAIWLKKDRLEIEFDSKEKINKKKIEKITKKIKLPLEFVGSGDFKIIIFLKGKKIKNKALFIKKLLQNL